MWPDVLFQYTGNTALTVRGIVTGKIYRFDAQGSSVTVDYRDAGIMHRITALKKIN